MFVTKQFFILLPCFFLYLILLKGFYKKANCKALEAKDFFFTFLFTCSAVLFLSLVKIPVTTTAFAYLFLISFIAILLYVDSIRFKSLM